ncbi:SGNH/GDSL hydrolase family protein [Roseobacter sp. S98]|uniref:SGNH/GDSL hydrolase family protein n=1 Tax=Roseobacter algicola (ex Choi et al. 2025) (nom. illeg.) TaxID=3092138 RepID=UPI0035C72BC1
MMSTLIRAILAAAVCFVAGVGVTLALMPEKRPASLACRPSAPQALATKEPILVLGNSLAFDSDWQIDGKQTVNCARQGLTVAAALPLIDELPDIAPKSVVLVFGTVELVRDTADPEVFRSSLVKLVESLNAKYDPADIVVLGVPATGEDWSYDLADAKALNRVIAEIDDVSMLSLDTVLAQQGSAAHYDGVHLTPSMYPSIWAALETHLAIDHAGD